MSSSSQTKQVTSVQLQQGETAIHNAPTVALTNGETCIPQHYLQFQHTRESVEKVILDISFCSDYPVFVGTNEGGIYIQVGIIGFDNYQRSRTSLTKKLVYGRKWRVEPNLPTSEIIQTVFLAIKTAREHEVRELFTLRYKNKLTTVFNNHQDLPVLARLRTLLHAQPIDTVNDIEIFKQAIAVVNYDHASFKIAACEQRSMSSWLFDIDIYPTSKTRLPELFASDGVVRLTLIVNELSTSVFYHQLFSELLALSNDYVSANFSYKGFNRFDKTNNVLMLAEILIAQRQRRELELEDEFVDEFIKNNYDTDKTRVPKLYQGELGEKIKQKLATIPQLDGILPEMTMLN